jgi:hypothetical protein
MRSGLGAPVGRLITSSRCACGIVSSSTCRGTAGHSTYLRAELIGSDAELHKKSGGLIDAIADGLRATVCSSASVNSMHARRNWRQG